MCLAVPMKITAIDGFNATCEAKGIQREVSLFMLQGEPIDIGDHVAVVGRVRALEVPSTTDKPLVFFRGKLCQLDSRTVPSKGTWQRDHYAEW